MVAWNYQELPIENPSFEGEYQNQGGKWVAPGWRRWHNSGAPPREEGQGPCAEPEYHALDAAQYPYRVTDGQAAQCWKIQYKVMDGGLLQATAIPNTEVDFVQFSLDAQAWCSDGGDPLRSEGEMYVALGVDPYGRTDPFELGVLWSPWWPVGAEFQRIDGPIVKVYTDVGTLFIRAWNKWRLVHNDVIVDNAVLYGISFSDEGGGGENPPPASGVDYDEIEARMARQLARLKVGLE